jgi:dissimilatory sulfite reductase (desulfoviridin) alpha/beta subunit
MHDLREIVNASERLGHGSISITEQHLHTLPDADETAVDAFDKVRRRLRR